MGRSGLTVTWLNCKGADQTDREARCQTSLSPSELILRLRPSTDADWLRRSPGAAIGLNGGWTSAGGKMVTLSLDAAERLAEQNGGGLGNILGCLMAHEIGHAFGLRHSALGIMKARFTSGDVQAIFLRQLVFNAQQSETLRQGIIRRCRAAATEGSIGNG